MTFPCMEPENAAAVAKKLHQTALLAESFIYTKEQLLRSAVNRPTAVETSTAPYTGLVIAFDENVSPPVTSNFINFPQDQPSDTVFNDDGFFRTLGEGIYEIGWAGNVIASGVADVASHRTFKLRQVRPDPEAFLNPTIYTAGYTVYEPNTGNGVDFSFSTMMRIKPGDSVLFTINHGNNSSTLTLSTGSIFWMHKLSDVDLTVVL